MDRSQVHRIEPVAALTPRDDVINGISTGLPAYVTDMAIPLEDLQAQLSPRNAVIGPFHQRNLASSEPGRNPHSGGSAGPFRIALGGCPPTP